LSAELKQNALFQTVFWRFFPLKTVLSFKTLSYEESIRLQNTDTNTVPYCQRYTLTDCFSVILPTGKGLGNIEFYSRGSDNNGLVSNPSLSAI